jgi:hypothetical protein
MPRNDSIIKFCLKSDARGVWKSPLGLKWLYGLPSLLYSVFNFKGSVGLYGARVSGIWTCFLMASDV